MNRIAGKRGESGRSSRKAKESSYILKDVGTAGFFGHLRPIGRIAFGTSFAASYHLGFWAGLLLAIELVSGLLLMAYYDPTPAGAYPSIIFLQTLVPFGQLLRGLHRLAGDLLVVVTFAHLVKVLFNGGGSMGFRFTWLSGVVLLLLVQAVSFSGYLLPWDQQSYWAVTVGTSLFGHLPFIGDTLQTGLRGGHEMGAGGLLRFYTLHVVVLPAALALVLTVHCYQVAARRRRMGKPAQGLESRQPHTPSLPWPASNNLGLELTLLALVVLLAACGWYYQPPLGPEANPASTPPHPLAPWFLLWIQGLLVGKQQIAMGLLVPAVLTGVIFLLPWLQRLLPMQGWPVKAVVVSLLLAFLTWSTLRAQQVVLPAGSAVESALTVLAPAGNLHPTRELSYPSLAVGVYPLKQDGASSPPQIAALCRDIHTLLEKSRQAGHVSDFQGLLLVDQIQDRLKQLTVRIRYRVAASSGYDSEERSVYLYERELP